MKAKTFWIPTLFLIFVTLWLRLANLGYSDYHGDEIRAMWRPAPGQSAIQFLYQQQKGPIEFLVSYLIRFINPAYSDELLSRLPFTIAGLLAIYFFFRLVKLHFGLKIALYATLLLSINGIFVGLMRILQYQSFVILFCTLTLYAFSLALHQERWKFFGVYAGMFFWTLALFTHYDSLLIVSFALYLLYLWFTQNNDLTVRRRLLHLMIPIALSALVLGIYYIPYLKFLADSTKDYWALRIAGEGANPEVNPSSLFIFNLYNPILGSGVYITMGLLSLFSIRKTFPALLWFIIPWAFMELIIYSPATHIYTYLMPAAILVAFGLEVLENTVEKIFGNSGKILNYVWLALLFITLAGISHRIFIDHTPEYPFETKRILMWTLGGKIKGYPLHTFGFPHSRHWHEIGEYVLSSENNGYYYTNETDFISSFYVPLNFSIKNAGHYIFIQKPQSFNNLDLKDKAVYWRTHYKPVKVMETDGRVVAEIYYMPSGSLEKIIKAGY